eukprot:3018322-Prymnesium_polylepis.1
MLFRGAIHRDGDVLRLHSRATQPPPVEAHAVRTADAGLQQRGCCNLRGAGHCGDHAEQEADPARDHRQARLAVVPVGARALEEQDARHAGPDRARLQL